MAAVLLDTNVLVYAAYQRSPLHRSAAELVARGLEERGRYCIAPQNLTEFAAVTTRRRRAETPLSTPDLVRMVDRLYRSRNLLKIYPRRGTIMRTIREGAALAIYGSAYYDVFLAVTMRDAGIKFIVT